MGMIAGTRTRLELRNTPTGNAKAWHHAEEGDTIPTYVVRGGKLYEIKTLDGNCCVYWPVKKEDIEFWDEGEPTRGKY